MRHRKNRTMKGGFWDNFTDMFKKKPETTTTTTTSPSSSDTIETSSSSSTLTGGRRRRRTRRIRRRRTMRGGYSASHSLNDLAATASPFSGNKTAQPQVWLGGRSKKHRHNRRCKH